MIINPMGKLFLLVYVHRDFLFYRQLRQVQLFHKYYTGNHMKADNKAFYWLLVVVISCMNNIFAQTELFKFIRTVQVTPDPLNLTGSFARINYVPATDRFVITFGTKGSIEKGICKGAGYAYKEYTFDMRETGKAGLITWDAKACEANDSGSDMIDNTYYFVHVPSDSGTPYGWRITKFDAINWTRLKEKYIYLTNPMEGNLDPCVAFVNGQLDVSDQYNQSGIWQDGHASHHHFFNLNLDSLGVKILNDTALISGASMIYIDGIYHIISANEYSGDLVVLKYDSIWNYLGAQKLIEQAFWSQGVVFDGKRFYVSYLDTRKRTIPGFFPVRLNVHLAVFDRLWNLVEDVAVTNFDSSDFRQPGRPWVILHGNQLYVSYDVDTIDSITKEELLRWQAYVSIYELDQNPSSIKDHELVGNFRLEQNYPNPFNPSTKIKYGLNNPEFVSLKVYDILGNEAAILVNEYQAAGEYQVDFGSSSVLQIPSGVYFYQLKAGNFMQTKKMILLR
jgi:hypothetical protein